MPKLPIRVGLNQNIRSEESPDRLGDENMFKGILFILVPGVVDGISSNDVGMSYAVHGEEESLPFEIGTGIDPGIYRIYVSSPSPLKSIVITIDFQDDPIPTLLNQLCISLQTIGLYLAVDSKRSIPRRKNFYESLKGHISKAPTVECKIPEIGELLDRMSSIESRLAEIASQNPPVEISHQDLEVSRSRDLDDIKKEIYASNDRVPELLREQLRGLGSEIKEELSLSLARNMASIRESNDTIANLHRETESQSVNSLQALHESMQQQEERSLILERKLNEIMSRKSSDVITEKLALENKNLKEQISHAKDKNRKLTEQLQRAEDYIEEIEVLNKNPDLTL